MGEGHGQTGVTAIRKAFLADGLQTWSRATVGLGPKNKRYLLPTGSDLPPSTNVLSFPLRPLPVLFKLVLSSKPLSPILSCCRIVCFRAGAPSPLPMVRELLRSQSGGKIG